MYAIILTSNIFDNSKPIEVSRHHYVVICDESKKEVELGKFEHMKVV